MIGVVTAALITPLCMWMAHRWNILDRPGGLKTHGRPVPYLGGLALYIGFLASVLGVVAWTDQSIGGMQEILIGSGLIFLLGLIDDIHPLTIPVKFLWQGLVALGVALWGDITIQLLPWTWANVMLTVGWVVGMTNAFNIIDIMDGLSGGVTVLAALAFALLAFAEGMTEVALIGASLSGAAMGVLFYNTNPAKIYFGDAGALMMGFVLATLAIAARYTTHHLSGYAAPLLILAVPLFDTLFVMWQRSRKGRSVFFGSPDHFPLRLERHGWDRGLIVRVIWTGTAVLSLFVIMSQSWNPLTAGVGYAIVVLILARLGWWFHKYAP